MVWPGIITFAGKRAWRHHLARRWKEDKKSRTDARKGYGIRLLLSLILIAEMIHMVLAAADRMNVSLFCQEKQIMVEWVNPWQPGKGEKPEADGAVYGVRICPETLEIQLYRHEQSIEDH